MKRSRPVDWKRYISVDPEICHGKPCFKGTRIMVSIALEFLEAGTDFKEIKAGYPSLTRAHLTAALQFAREALEKGRSFAFASAAHALSHR